MKLSVQIGPYLPYLRRFARALTGSQKSGDAYAAALLQGIAADPSLIQGHSDLKVALYHGLCFIWDFVSLNERPTPHSPHGRRLFRAGSEHWDAPVRSIC